MASNCSWCGTASPRRRLPRRRARGRAQGRVLPPRARRAVGHPGRALGAGPDPRAGRPRRRARPLRALRRPARRPAGPARPPPRAAPHRATRSAASSTCSPGPRPAGAGASRRGRYAVGAASEPAASARRANASTLPNIAPAAPRRGTRRASRPPRRARPRPRCRSDPDDERGDRPREGLGQRARGATSPTSWLPLASVGAMRTPATRHSAAMTQIDGASASGRYVERQQGREPDVAPRERQRPGARAVGEPAGALPSDHTRQQHARQRAAAPRPR